MSDLVVNPKTGFVVTWLIEWKWMGIYNFDHEIDICFNGLFTFHVVNVSCYSSVKIKTIIILHLMESARGYK